jgi:hypothetical protein
MNILLSFITSGGIKWLTILILVAGLAGGLYMKHRQIVELEKQVALQQYNITQLEQNVKDNAEYVRKLEELNNYKGKIVADLYRERDSLEEKMRGLEEEINRNINAGHDRQSSKVLKDLFKALGSN